MRGIIQYINPAQYNGVLLAKDGSQYGFTLFDCMPGTQPRMGDVVDFNVQNGVATEIAGAPARGPAEHVAAEYAPQPQTGFDLRALRQAIAQPQPVHAAPAPAHAPPRAPRAQGRLTLAAMANDWRNILAALALLACMLPFMSYATQSASLFGTVSLAQAGVDSLKAAQAMTKQYLAPAPMGNRGAAMPQNKALMEQQAQLSSMEWGLRLSYLLYLIPGLAAATLFAAFRGGNNARPAFWLGVSCLTLPVLAEAGDYALSSFKDQMMMGLGAMIPGAWSLLGLGFYLLCGIGVSLVLVHCRIIGAAPPNTYMAKYA
jgi:hypothetical protein